MLTDECDDLPPQSALVSIGLQARYRPAKTAIEDGRRASTYAEIWTSARRAAIELAGLGVVPGQRVAFALDAGVDYVIGVLAAQMVGGVAVPVNTRLTASETADFLAPVEPSLVVTSEAYRHVQQAVGPGRASSLTLGSSVVAASRGVASPSPLPDGSALILGTGGTTGVPKGAVFTHECLWRWTSAAAANNRVSSSDVELFVAPFFHGTLVTGVMTTLTQGGTVVVLERFDPNVAAEQIAQGRITRMLGAATVIDRLVRASERMDMAGAALRFLQFGMSASRSGFANEIRAVFPHTEVITGYGATEFGPVTRTYSSEFDDAGDPIGVGHPVPGADIVIETDGELHVDPGVAGEVLVRSPWQMMRYCVADPALDTNSRRDAYLRSGDIGRFDVDGNLLITGRLKDTIRTGGETVYPAEVEAVLYRNSAVAECAVYGVPDTDWGERVEAAVVLARDVPQAELDAHLRQALAGYKIPKRIRVMSALPQTSASKIDRRALRQAAQREDARADRPS